MDEGELCESVDLVRIQQNGMQFGTAFNQLNGFKRIARKPWQEKLPCMPLERQGDSLVKITYKRNEDGTADVWATEPWVPCIDDMLEEDWVLTEDKPMFGLKPSTQEK